MANLHAVGGDAGPGRRPGAIVRWNINSTWWMSPSSSANSWFQAM